MRAQRSAREEEQHVEWTPEILAEGLAFPEGPIAVGGGEVVFTQIRGQCLSLYSAGKVTTIAHTGGGANGATLGPDGAFYVANNGGLSMGPQGQWRGTPEIAGCIQRITPSGEQREIAREMPGAPPHRPNDLCFGPDGKLYFTDPHNWEDLAHLRPGRVDRMDMDGRVEQLATVAQFPNGIGFGNDGRLYVAESVTQTVWAYPWTPAALGPAERFCTLPKGYPDGFCFAANGDLIVCGSLGDTVCIFDARGQLVERLDAPPGTEPTNCCIGDGRLYVTLSGVGQLAAFEYPDAALPLYPERAQMS
jgi:gluconolactonase